MPFDIVNRTGISIIIHIIFNLIAMVKVELFSLSAVELQGLHTNYKWHMHTIKFLKEAEHIL